MKVSKHYKPGDNQSANLFESAEGEKIRIYKGKLTQIKPKEKTSDAGKSYDVIRMLIEVAGDKVITLDTAVWNPVLSECTFDMEEDEEIQTHETKSGAYYNLTSIEYDGNVAGRVPEIKGPWYSLDNENLEDDIRVAMEADLAKAPKDDGEEKKEKKKKKKKDKKKDEQ